METFDAEWLAMREPVDHASRAPELAGYLDEWRGAQGLEHPALRVLDLGSGSGSNVRYLAPRLSGPQTWTLIDHDADLVTGVRPPSKRVSVIPIAADLAHQGLLHVDHADLVTASALLDLVSEVWMDALAERCAAVGSAALFALSYDGGIEWRNVDDGPAEVRSPPDPLDERIRTAVNVHQRQDKGLGVALGPEAARHAQRCFETRGYRTWRVPSPWRLGPSDLALTTALVAGWAGVAPSTGDISADEVAEWADRRLAGVREGRIELMVGHQDLLALPGGPALPPR